MTAGWGLLYFNCGYLSVGGHKLEGYSLNLMSVVWISNKSQPWKHFCPSKDSLIPLTFVLYHLPSFKTCIVYKKTSRNDMIYVCRALDVVFTAHHIWLLLNNLQGCKGKLLCVHLVRNQCVVKTMSMCITNISLSLQYTCRISYQTWQIMIFNQSWFLSWSVLNCGP